MSIASGTGTFAVGQNQRRRRVVSRPQKRMVLPLTVYNVMPSFKSTYLSFSTLHRASYWRVSVSMLRAMPKFHGGVLTELQVARQGCNIAADVWASMMNSSRLRPEL